MDEDEYLDSQFDYETHKFGPPPPRENRAFKELLEDKPEHGFGRAPKAKPKLPRLSIVLVLVTVVVNAVMAIFWVMCS